MKEVIRPETAADHRATRAVNRLASGRDAEGRLVDSPRAQGYARASHVAEVNGSLVGPILFSALPITYPDGEVEALALAPLSVHPSYQRRGIGSALVRNGLRACRDAGFKAVLVLGHPEFYPRFGFSAESAGRLISPYSGPASMVLELAPGALVERHSSIVG